VVSLVQLDRIHYVGVTVLTPTHPAHPCCIVADGWWLHSRSHENTQEAWVQKHLVISCKIIIIIIIIIINEKISVAFSPKTARTRNTH